MQKIICGQFDRFSNPIQCKRCNQMLSQCKYSKSRKIHRICKLCDREHTLKYQKMRQSHPSYKPICKVKYYLRKLRKHELGNNISKSAWLDVKDYEKFLEKWNHQSVFCRHLNCVSSSSDELVFWFRDMENLSFDNAIPCTTKELDTIVGKANGNLKVGVYILTNGDEEKSQKILEQLNETISKYKK